LCSTATWTEHDPEIGSRASLARRARVEICRRVGQDADSVAQVAREFGIGWHTAMAAVREHGLRLVENPATPDPLRPHQPHRPTRDRQIPNLDAAAAMTDGPHPTPGTAHPIGGRFDLQPPLAHIYDVRAHDEAGHVEQRGRAFTTVTNHQGSPSRAALDSSKSVEAPGLIRGPTNPARSRHDPSVHREEP
jgi:hypothetical protein